MRWWGSWLVALAAVVGASAPPVWTWPLASPPAPVVIAGYHPPAQRWLPGHRGVDLATTPGRAVLAPSAGVVTFAGTVAGTPVVVVRASSGLRSTLEPVVAAVVVGTVVRRGQPVGVSAASDLHWGVVGGRGHGARYRDPLALLHPRAPVLLPWA